MTLPASRTRNVHGIVLEPDWIVPVQTERILHGCIVAINGLIEFIGTELPSRFHSLPRIRLEQTAILPGWINSHCHLEFSDLETPIPCEGTFDQWLARVIARRSLAPSLSTEDRSSLRRDAIRKGLFESWRCGVRWIIDNVTEPWDPAWIHQWQSDARSSLHDLAANTLVPDTLLSVQPCFELIDVQSNRWQQTSDFAFEQIDAPKLSGVVSPSLAPHAPYTASLRVTRRAAQWSSSHSGLVSMHLAESREELDWLEQRSGTLGDWIAPKTDAIHRSNLGTIDDHLEILSHGCRSLVIHANYLKPHQIDFLARHRDRMAVVYCPRTHAWFGHTTHPVRQLASQGVSVLIGTDSRASTANLNLWEELGFIARTGALDAAWSPIGSISGDAARFLNLPFGIGRLEVGAASRLSAVRWDENIAMADCVLQTERDFAAWMMERGKPYPLEIDARLALPRTSD
jgi:cytosine/adenosine deaminase-related metal-dependent hydrolase